ncbi:Na+/H+ antiporter subunit G [Silicimonas algicola]|uniref:Multisubunit potassium/proton antiporter PhaG subunit n=1 Tax=Silicimonas algicola TaxID=1826607 RepID=A0A316FYZ9_9RHOB|nr:Na+/H+ antiporter subunit G [Silicimonas algicola]AZQ67612.1 Na+/H+ antiporter subunit G [Silicimonas algicola]PWK52770.1 multisubunit potassium/proton antiporter PhaG subunit [Silicimonas algicola]
MSGIVEILISVFIVLGGVFGLVGSFGLVKLGNTIQRLHGPTKATTLGIGCALIASMLYFFSSKGSVSFHELLITLFLFLTAPISANFIAKAYIVRNIERHELPASGGEYGWSVYDDPPALNQEKENEGARPGSIT